MMNDRMDKTIRLSGKDAIDFANSLFRPSIDEIEDRRRVLESINESITISRTVDGYEAEVADLDLSFLNNNRIVGDFSMNTSFKVARNSEFHSSENTDDSSVVYVKIINQYLGADGNEFLLCAA